MYKKRLRSHSLVTIGFSKMSSANSNKGKGASADADTSAVTPTKPPHRIAPLKSQKEDATRDTEVAVAAISTEDAGVAPPPKPPAVLSPLSIDLPAKDEPQDVATAKKEVGERPNLLADIMAECVAETTGEDAPAGKPIVGPRTDSLAKKEDAKRPNLLADIMAECVAETTGEAAPGSPEGRDEPAVVKVDDPSPGKAKPTFFGAIDGGDDDDESSASSESDASVESDEEEIEVNEEAAAAAEAARGTVSKPKKAPAAPAPAFSINTRQPLNKPEGIADERTAGDEEVATGDFFGIKYQPKRRVQTGTAFENQTVWTREYEQELGENNEMLRATQHSSQSPRGGNGAGGGDEDDEFDEFDFDEGGQDANEHPGAKLLGIKTAEEQKIKFEKEKMEIIEQMKARAAAEQSEIEENARQEKAAAPEEEGRAQGSDSNFLKNEFAKAAKSISMQYADADGDASAGATDEAAPEKAQKPIPEIRLSIHENTGPLEVFIEEDEEEEEEDEDEFEHQQIQRVTITPKKDEAAQAPASAATGASTEKSATAPPSQASNAEAEREAQAAEFDAIAELHATSDSKATMTAGERIAKASQGRILRHVALMKHLLADEHKELEKGRPIVVESKPVYLKRASGFARLFKKKPKKLNPSLFGDRDTLFLLAKVSVDPAKDMHVQLLQAIYRRMTGADRDIPLRASPWMDIGFQTANPLTDIRGTGILGLAHVLGFLDSHLDVVLKIHKLSQTDTNSFPLVVTGFNLSRGCMSAVRQGALNGLCNKNGNVLDTVQSFYNAVFFAFYAKWRQTTYLNALDSIAHFNPIFQEVLTNSMRDPVGAIAAFQKYRDNLNLKSVGAIQSFTNVEDEGQKKKAKAL